MIQIYMYREETARLTLEAEEQKMEAYLKARDTFVTGTTKDTVVFCVESDEKNGTAEDLMRPHLLVF